MEIAKQEVQGTHPSASAPVKPARAHWSQIGAISIFWFALNFHWNALLTVVLPSQILMLVGNTQKVDALAFVLIPGSFVSLIANPLFGWLSDRTQGRLAIWGRRRPYILLGTLVNIGALIWMANASSTLSLAFAYAFVQFSSNAAQAPFHALLPDVVPEQQRGAVSGLMGFLMIAGTISGVVLAGLLVDSSLPPTLYWQGIHIMYGIIIAVLFLFMLLTVAIVREGTAAAASRPAVNTKKRVFPFKTFLLLAAALLLAFCLLWLWNQFMFPHFRISEEGQQVLLEIIVTLFLLHLFDFRPRRD